MEDRQTPTIKLLNLTSPLPDYPSRMFHASPLPATDLEEVIQGAAKRQAISAALIKAVIKQESAYKPCAISAKGAKGLMQLMPATAEQLHVTDPLDPEQNIQGGAAYLKQMLDRYKGDLRLALVAYNAGPGRADQPKTSSNNLLSSPLETQTYVAGIFAELGISQWNEAETAIDAEGRPPDQPGVAANDKPEAPLPGPSQPVKADAKTPNSP